MAVFPIGMALLPVFSPVFCFQSAHPSWFLFNCALPKLYKFTRFLDLRAFAGFCGRFADFFWAQLCAFICVGARDMKMAWYVPATQPGCKPCSVIFKMSLVVIVWPLGSKTRQTSKIRRDSENWVILGHTPKLPKIIDRRNVQVTYYKYLQAKGKSKLHDVISTAMDYNLGLRVPLKSRQDSLLFQGVSQPPQLR